MTCGIYRIKNKINNKCYVGSSKNIEGRIKTHFSGKGSCYLRNSINKYGIENFESSILKICVKKKLLYWEQKFIDTLCPQYNLSKIAGRVEFTTKIRQKMSDSHKGIANNTGKHWKVSEEGKRNMAIARIGNINGRGGKGLKRSEKTKHKMSEVKMGNQHSLGHKHSKKTKTKMKLAWKKRKEQKCKL